MAKYRSTYTHRGVKIEVDAVRFAGGNFDEIERFVGGDAEFRNGKLVVATRQGALWADDGDWIVKHPTGRFIALKSDIFAYDYEPIR